jgi:lipopolysaccharide transport system permease protein
MKTNRALGFDLEAHGVAADNKLTFVIRARRSVHFLDLHAVWAYRGLLYFLVWRDVKVRYKQTAIGIGWAIFQPLMTMLVFTMVFWRFAGVESGTLPYQIVAFVGLLPWNYFSQAVVRSTTSLVGESNLISKVYFPRVIVPISAVVSPLVDFAFTLLTLAGLLFWFGIVPPAGVLALPLFLLLAFATALGVALWTSALNARYRDVAQIMPFLTQLWLFASPVAYPISSVPLKWRSLYDLNPMVGVIEGFRWAVLGNSNLEWSAIAASVIVIMMLVCSGLVFFTYTERFLADVL